MVQISRINRIQSEKYDKSNVDFAKTLYKQATEILKKASEENDMELYRKSISLYYMAITNYSNFTEPYIALSYISWKMDEHKKAIDLIKSALSIEPFNKHAKKLLEEISYDLKQKEFLKQDKSNLLSIKDKVSQNTKNNNIINSTNKTGTKSSGTFLNKITEAKKNIKIVASNSFLDKLSKV
jgi:tetratricopeptide (TPR) repeat protein